MEIEVVMIGAIFSPVALFIFVYFFNKKDDKCLSDDHDFKLVSTSETFDYLECSRRNCNHSKGIHKKNIDDEDSANFTSM